MILKTISLSLSLFCCVCCLSALQSQKGDMLSILSRHTGQSEEKIDKDIMRPFYMQVCTLARSLLPLSLIFCERG